MRERAPRGSGRGVFALALLALAACGGRAAPSPVPPPPAPAPAPVAFEPNWKAYPFGVLLSPKHPCDADGAFDVVWHFHAGKAADASYRDSGLRAVVVDFTLDGLGTTPYWNAFDDDARFGRMQAALEHAMAKRGDCPGAHVRRTGLVCFSAGYASAQRILAVPRYYDAIDAVIVLDGLHTGFVTDGGGRKRANLTLLAPFVRAAKDATAGKKLFVFTHSAIDPIRYASTAAVADALVAELGGTFRPGPPGPPYGARRGADVGDAHVLGFPGDTAHAHVEHDHRVGAVLRRWLLPRWAR
jgi:hypothetical protein